MNLKEENRSLQHLKLFHNLLISIDNAIIRELEQIQQDSSWGKSNRS